MKSQVPAAEFAERVLILYQKPFGDGKLFPRVPSGALPPGENGHCEAFVRDKTIQFRCESDVDLR